MSFPAVPKERSQGRKPSNQVRSAELHSALGETEPAGTSLRAGRREVGLPTGSKAFLGLVNDLSSELKLACGAVIALAALNAAAPSFQFASESALAALGLIAGLAIAWAGRASLIERGLAALRERRLSAELCCFAGLLVTLGLSIYGLAEPASGLREPRMYNALAVLALLTIAAHELHFRMLGVLRRRATHRLRDLAPTARLIKRGSPIPHEQAALLKDLSDSGQVVPSSEIKPNDILRVSAGEFLACDGFVLEGASELEERRYSWRPILKLKSKEQEVFAGSKVVSGEIVVQCANSQDDSEISQFIDYLDKLQEGARGAAAREESWRQIVYVAIVFLAACSVLFWSDMDSGLGMVCSAAISTLFVTLCYRGMCFQPLVEAISLARAFEAGILVRKSGSLDKLCGIRTIIFDYSNSPLSSGIKFWSFEMIDARVDRDQLCSSLLAIFGQTEGELFSAASQFVRPLVSAPKLFKLSDYHFYEGRGIAATLGGAEFSVGTEEFLIERGVHLDASEAKPLEIGQNALYIAVGEEIMARMIWSSDVLEDGKELIEGLHAAGLRTYLFGECQQAQLDEVGKLLGIELAFVKGNLRRDEYPAKIGDLKPVAIYGAGKLERSILEACDASITVFDDVSWDVSRADVTLFDGSPEMVSAAFRISRDTRAAHIQNAVLVVGGSIGLMLLAWTGLVMPIATALSALIISALSGLIVLRSARPVLS